MKKTLLLVLAMIASSLGVKAAIGDDLTSTYLQNANFSADEPLQLGICTYEKDVAANGTIYSGMQPVNGWTATNPYVAGGADIDARAAGVYAVGKQYLYDYSGDVNDEFIQLFLGGTGYMPPLTNSAEGEDGNVLGIVGVWSAGLQYYQEVTLPAGAYKLEFPVYNANTSASSDIDANLCGFIADGASYVCEEKNWEIGQWTMMSVTFLLKETTTGKISVGYKAVDLGSGKMPHLYFDYVKLTEADPAPIIKAEVDALKETLEALVEQGEKLGVSTAAAQAVLDNENATLEDVQKAIDDQTALNDAGMTDFTDFFINNAHFAVGTPLDNGVCTYDYDMPANNTSYFGMQPIDMWNASSPSDNVQRMANSGSKPENPLNSRASGLFKVGSGEEVWLGSVQDKTPATKANGATEGNVFGFISVWSGSASYTQDVTLPAGSYTITIPTYNERGTGAIAKNLCGFIASDGTEYLAETTTFPVGVWSNETIEFELDEETDGVITIGYTAAGAGSGSMPHLFIDEFTLMYNGLLDIDPSLLALQGVCRTAETYLSYGEPYEASLLQPLEDAFEAGRELVAANSADVDANTKAATALNNAIAAIRNSAIEYAKFEDFIEGKLAETIEKYYGHIDMGDFAEELSDSQNEYQDAYENGTYTTEQIEGIITGFDAVVVAEIQKVFDAALADDNEHDLDITSLLDANLKFNGSSVDGWTAIGNDNTLTKSSNPKLESQVANVCEIWGSVAYDATATTTIANLPAGVYEITANGFYRDGAIGDNYNNYTGGNVAGKAYLTANYNRTLMHNQAELEGENDDLHNGDAGNGVFLPNGQGTAQKVFADSNFDVLNSVTTALPAAGDLTVGVAGVSMSEGGSWIVWGPISVIYKGKDGMNNALYEQVLTLSEKLADIADIATIVVKADELVSAALDAAEEVSEDSPIEELVSTIEDMKYALEYANEASDLYDELVGVYSIYADYLAESVDSDEPEFTALLEEIDGGFDDAFESNEAIKEFMTALPTAWVAYVQYPVLTEASLEDPADITPAILNADFEGITGNAGAAYWSVTTDGGSSGYSDGIYECYDNNSFDIHQTISGLAEGYYRVKVQAFYRPGNNEDNATNFAEDDTYGRNAILYANKYEKPLKNVLEREDEEGEIAPDPISGADGEVKVAYKDYEEFYVPNNRAVLAQYFEAGIYWNELDVYVGEDGVLTIGIKKDEHIGGDWCPYDNFQLWYLGTEAPTAVESVAVATPVAKSAAIFDLAGRRVAKAQKGIYIINGVKVVK